MQTSSESNEGFKKKSWTTKDLLKAVDMSTEAWKRYEKENKGQASVSDFLLERGVKNLFLDEMGELQHVNMFVESASVGEMWGRDDMLLRLYFRTDQGYQKQNMEYLQAAAKFSGALYILHNPPHFAADCLSPFWEALPLSPNPPTTLSISSLGADDRTALKIASVMQALRHNSRVRNFAVWASYPDLGFDNIDLMDGISLNCLHLHNVFMSPKFLDALPNLPSHTITHSLSLDNTKESHDSVHSAAWHSSFRRFLQWQLKHLSLVDFRVEAEDMLEFMAHLQNCSNTSVYSLTIGDLQHTPTSQLVAAVVDALHYSGLPFLHIERPVPFTNWSEDFSDPAIEAQLLRNRQRQSNTGFTHLFHRKVSAAAVRLFICGDAKDDSIVNLSSLCEPTRVLHKLKGWFFSCHGTVQERTRGIEVRTIMRGGIQVSLWDMAGQTEFHAFHDLMFPDAGASYGSPAMFMFVWSPVDSKDGRIGECKNPDEFKASFHYWLKFIASKTRQSNTFRKLIVVFTRKDQVDLVEDALSTSIDTLTASFDKIIEKVKVLVVDARNPDSVKPVASCIFSTARAVLHGVEVYGICSEVTKYLSSREAQASLVRKQPIIHWDDFSKLCKDKFEVSDPEVQKAIALSLNESGDIIYLGNLPFLVLDPNWFCHEVMGNLIHFPTSHTAKKFIAIHGYAKQDYLEKLLMRSTHSKVEGHLLVNLLEAMHLCCKVPEDADCMLFIPATLSQTKSFGPGGSLQWRLGEADKLKQQYSYVGRRLECDRKDVTFLSPGLFPMIQVVFGNAFGASKADLDLRKDFMSICMQNMEIIMEFGRAKDGHIIDVMVRAPDLGDVGNAFAYVEQKINVGNTLAFVEEKIIKTLIRVCAQPVGNQGVTLVEGVIRPDCLHDPAPLHVREDQCALIIDLKQELRKQLEAGEKLLHLWKGSPYLQPVSNHFIDLLGFEEYMQVLMAYKSSLEDVNASYEENVASGSTSTSVSHDGLAHEGDVPCLAEGTSALRRLHMGHDGNHDVIRDDDEIQAYHSQNKMGLEENVEVNTGESQNQQIVDSLSKDMVRKIYQELRSMNNRLKGMDTKLDVMQKGMHTKLDAMHHSIENLRSDVLPKIQRMVEQSLNFSVESEAGRIPRFVFLTTDENAVGARRRMVRVVFKELKSVRIELFCEDRVRPHQVEGQGGLCVSTLDEGAYIKKALPYVNGFLKMLTLVAKVGAHVVGGAGSMVPDFSQLIAVALDTPNFLDNQGLQLARTAVSPAAFEGWHQWLVSVLQKNGGMTESNIYNKFRLRRALYQDSLKVAWLCDTHYRHQRSHPLVL